MLAHAGMRPLLSEDEMQSQLLLPNNPNEDTSFNSLSHDSTMSINDSLAVSPPLQGEGSPRSEKMRLNRNLKLGVAFKDQESSTGSSSSDVIGKQHSFSLSESSSIKGSIQPTISNTADYAHIFYSNSVSMSMSIDPQEQSKMVVSSLDWQELQNQKPFGGSDSLYGNMKQSPPHMIKRMDVNEVNEVKLQEERTDPKIETSMDVMKKMRFNNMGTYNEAVKPLTALSGVSSNAMSIETPSQAQISTSGYVTSPTGSGVSQLVNPVKGMSIQQSRKHATLKPQLPDPAKNLSFSSPFASSDSDKVNPNGPTRPSDSLSAMMSYANVMFPRPVMMPPQPPVDISEALYHRGVAMSHFAGSLDICIV